MPEVDDIVPRSRPPQSPRWLWIAALTIGAACAILFVVAAVRGGDASSSSPGAAPATNHSGFPTGLLLGVGVGIAIGWFAGRRAQSSAHSDRSRP